jgi:hypothetical protein
VQEQQVDLVDAELPGALVKTVQRLVVAVVGDPDFVPTKTSARST